MSYFTAKMHQIRFRLGRALAGFKGRTSIGEGKDQEAVALLEGARGLNLALAPPPFLFSAP